MSADDVHAVSTTLLDAARQLAALLDDDIAAHLERTAAAAERQRVAIDAARRALLADGDEGLAKADDIDLLTRAVARSEAAIELEPACKALGDVTAAARRATESSDPAVHALAGRIAALHLTIAHRQCVAALQPLARSLTPSARSDRR
jgi:hypothetical protein